MHRGSLFLIAGLLVTGPACALGRTRLPPPADSSVRLIVTNDRGGAITVDVLVSGASHRIGVVEAGTTGRFVVPSAAIGVGSVEFRAVGFPGGVVRSGSVYVTEGAVVEFRVGASQVSSSISVRP